MYVYIHIYNDIYIFVYIWLYGMVCYIKHKIYNYIGKCTSKRSYLNVPHLTCNCLQQSQSEMFHLIQPCSQHLHLQYNTLLVLMFLQSNCETSTEL